MTKIKQWIKENENKILGYYDYLHAHPEVSAKEYETQKFLLNELKKLDFDIQTDPAHTGILATWQGKEPGKVVGLRADMDALFQNVHGKWQANHSCGHDAHMTMALCAVMSLKKSDFELKKGTIQVLFQPAEEIGEGALACLKSGFVDDMDYLLGVHLRPKVEVVMGKAAPAIYYGASAQFKCYVSGVQAHGARPHLGVNVVDAIASAVQAINAIRMNPVIPSSAKVTQMNAGNSINIIPDEGEFSIDIRSVDNDELERIIKLVKKAVTNAVTANGSTVQMEEKAKMVATIPHKAMEEIVGAAIVDVLGENGFVPPPITPGAEDFNFYTKMKPELQGTMIGLGCDLEPGLHSPDMTFNKKAILNGVDIMAQAVVRLLEN